MFRYRRHTDDGNRSRSGVRLILLCVVAAVLVGLSGASSASGGQRTVALHLVVTGWGTVYVHGYPPALNCDVSAWNTCTATFNVRLGQKVVVTALPSATGSWKLATWTGACKASPASCSFRVNASRSVAVTFVPSGDRANPFPLHTLESTLGWQVKVNSVNRNADAMISTPPRPGFQYVLINLSLTSMDLGNAFPSLVFYDKEAAAPTEGISGTQYFASSCWPTPPPTLPGVAISPGQTVAGNVCYEVASHDVSSLELGGFYGLWPSTDYYGAGRASKVWFALH